MVDNSNENKNEINDSISYIIKLKSRNSDEELQKNVTRQYIRIIIIVGIIIFFIYITIKEQLSFSKDLDNATINWKTLNLNSPDYGYYLY